MFLLLVLSSASGVVNTKVASGLQNVGTGLHQGEAVFNLLLHQGKTPSSYDDASGSSIVTKGASFSKFIPATDKQLQKMFKHAKDFGVEGNFNKANADKFNQAIQKHVNSPGTKEIQGTYRGGSVTFQTDPNTGLTVIQNPNGSFLSGWKLNPQQLQYVLKDSKL